MFKYQFDFNNDQITYKAASSAAEDKLNKVPNNSIKVLPADINRLFDECHNIIFEVTEKCNLECEYCAYGYNYIQPKTRPLHRGKEMSWQTAKTLLDYYIEKWNQKGDNSLPIAINYYGGEPLTNFKLISKITDFILDNKPEEQQIIFHITTNAILLRRHIHWLKDNDFHISVSIDGNKTNNIYRKDKNGVESFNNVISTLDYISDTYPEYFQSRLMFQSVLNSNSNIDHIKSFFQDRYGKTTEFMPISKNHLSKHNDIDIIAGKWLKQKENSAIIDQATIIKRFTSYFYDDYLDFINSKPIVASGTCIPFSNRVFISASGLIYPCEKVDLNKPIGRIEKNSVHIDFRQIAQTYSRLFSYQSEYCYKCFFLKTCKHCLACEDAFSALKKPCKEFMRIDGKMLNKVINFVRTNPSNF